MKHIVFSICVALLDASVDINYESYFDFERDDQMSKELKEQWRMEAKVHGFEFFGVVEATELAKVPFPPHRGLDTPHGFLPQAKSVIVLGMHVWDPLLNAAVSSVLPDGAIPFGDVLDSQYYCFYYEVIEARAHRFATVIRDAQFKAVVTHGVHVKAAAALAGLGWIGKNTLCITPQLGPRQRWCAVVTDAVLPYDEVFKEDLCGDCERCIKACPVGAIIPGSSQGVEPGKKVDFNKCIIPQEMFTEPSKDWQKFAKKYTSRGCTECLICHDVCPIGKDEHKNRVKKYSHKSVK
ncbi:Epoxyqueuosine reductase [anaerobic digester metagenome]